MNAFRMVFLCLLPVLLVVGCSSDSSSPPAAPLSTSVQLTLATSGTLSSGTMLAGIAFTLALPDGVTVSQDSSGEIDAERLVKASGVTASSGGLVATAIRLNGEPERISLAVASRQKEGFAVGETLRLTLNTRQGGTFKPGDFPLGDFTVADVNGKAVSTLSFAVTEVKTE